MIRDSRVVHSTVTRRIAAALLLATLGGAQAAEPPAIAAASDLAYALTEIAEGFQRETGRTVKLSFGSSGNFARQILAGAPFELFLSADEEYIERLVQAGRTEDRGTLYAEGRLVLLVPPGSAVKADAELRDLVAAVRDGRLKRLAIANPEHAPYGRRAQEVLTHLDLWSEVQRRLVLGENISQAAQFTLSGSVEAGLVALSLVRAPRLSNRGSYALIPAAWHAPLRQRMVLIKGAGETARQFYLYMRTPATRAILDRYGFALPPP
jgi:molybdate transport system substrate-binding protein